MIEIKNVTKKYKKRTYTRKKYMQFALDNVSAKIEDGKIIAIIGINGSGKTTLLKAIAGFVRLDDGIILIDGKRVSIKTYKDLIFVPDFDTHFRNYTVNDMINFYKDFYPKWNDRKADYMLEFFNIDKNEVVDYLSKGNIAKIKLVMSFALDTKYILLDEPFNGIDIFKREEFVSMMSKYMKEDQTIIITTHELSEIEHLVDDVLILNDGRLMANFTAEDLRTNEGKSIVDKMREVSIYE
ncbi:ABC transporter ATP-binding protein [Peptostreptococcus equinus]|uniref:ABC transporter ATP-binding protein n=1 Tax=Peptostreptococcus equinus TaxID=3003601 RepID=A0ABY7JUD6_9FIRM|nr:ABC transporter ATP-binding protein [Peptostreptococcus sp. CBA3647]WAW15773.1 ABC transporter ATP-binding protein [Peptostreptococcus sp. CBA3647]